MKPNDLLRTPEWVWKPLGPFDLDPCAGADTNIAARNIRLEDGSDGLSEEWGNEFVWCNPPFSEKEKWIEKMIEHDNGILLLPDRTSTPWWGPLAYECGTVFLMGKKINFLGGSSSNNGGTTLFPFGLRAIHQVIASGLPGTLLKVRSYTGRSGE